MISGEPPAGPPERGIARLRQWPARVASQGITPGQFVFQLLVVTAGVYIAIAIQDRAERRSRSASATQMLAAIEQELAQDDSTIQLIIGEHADLRARLAEIARAARSHAPADTVIRRILDTPGSLSNRTFFSRRAGYSTLLAAGRLDAISDSKLRLQLVQIYEHDYTRLAQMGVLSDHIYLDIFRDALLQYWDYHLNRPIGSDARAAIRLSNAAERMSQFSEYYDGVMQAEVRALAAARQRAAKYLAQANR